MLLVSAQGITMDGIDGGQPRPSVCSVGWLPSVCSVGWFVSLLVCEEVLLADLCERKILSQLKIYDRLRLSHSQTNGLRAPILCPAVLLSCVGGSNVLLSCSASSCRPTSLTLCCFATKSEGVNQYPARRLALCAVVKALKSQEDDVHRGGCFASFRSCCDARVSTPIHMCWTGLK